MAVLGVSAYVGVNAQQKDAVSDIQMANVEALVSGESGNSLWYVKYINPSYWQCDAAGDKSCPGTP